MREIPRNTFPLYKVWTILALMEGPNQLVSAAFQYLLGSTGFCPDTPMHKHVLNVVEIESD